MKINDRAKIFLPFSALSGFSESLKEQEKIKVERSTLSSDQYDELNEVLRSLKLYDMIRVVYYSKQDECYLVMEGVYTKIDEIERYIMVVKTKILLDNIYSIEHLEKFDLPNK